MNNNSRPRKKRLPNLGNPMPESDARATVATLAAYRAHTGHSYERIANAIREWYALNFDNSHVFQGFSHGELDFDMDDNAIMRMVKGHVPSNQFIKATYLWIISNSFGKVEFERKQQEENLRSKEPDVLSVRRLFGHRADIQTIKISQWVGNYALYRPFHLEPKRKAQVNLLEIGSEESAFNCTLTSVFPAPLNPETKLVGQGKFTPLDADHAVALMTMNIEYFGGYPDPGTQAGSYMLHLSDPQRSPGIDGFRGILVASMGPSPSAWPIFAARLREGETIEPHVLDREEYRALPPIIRQQLDRGGVYWDEPDFPKSLSKGYAKPQEP